MTDRSADETRVLLLAPTARDAAAGQALLADARLGCCVCRNLSELCSQIELGAGVIVLPEEMILAGRGKALGEVLGKQPAWSSLPVIVLTAAGPDSAVKVRAILELGDVSLLKRPLEVATFVNAVQAALRDRERQYLVRDQVAELQGAQEALAQSDERLRFALAAGRLGSWELDLATGVMNCSDICKGNYGRPAGSDFSYSELREAIHSDDRQRVSEAVEDACSGKDDYDVEYRTSWPDGSVHWVLVRGRVSHGADGSPLRMSGVSLDITDAKHAEEDLRESELRFRALVTATSEVVYQMNPDWSEMRQLVGRRFIADTRKPNRAWIEKYIPSEERPRVLEAIADAVRRNLPFVLEHRVLRIDGTIGWAISRAIPIRNRAGEISEWFGAASDITARREAEEALARLTEESDRQKRLYETILSTTPDLVYVFNLEHRFTYANNALLSMWGKSWEEAIGKNCLELGYEPWHAAMHDQEIERVIATQKPIRGEVPFTGTNGRRIYDYIFVPVFGAEGEVEAVAGTTRDVTDRKSMEEDLRDADRKKDDFIALLAHELRNPLAPLRNGLEVMRLAGGDASIASRARAMMDRQLFHMVRLVDDLLDVSRISRNKMELRRERVLLADAVDAAVETARPMIASGEHELQVALPPGPVFIDADPTRLSQIIGNLLTNSAKYTARGGKIRLTAEREVDQVAVTVCDNGIGIPAESLNAIFDMFSQVDRSIERRTGGLGLGLAIVKGLVEMHGGSVTAVSAGEGQGSAFTIRLPLAKGVVERRLESNSPQGHVVRRVLVVDDNRDGAESMATMLRLMGDEVHTAHDGIEAVHQAEALRPDLILMDVGMPRLNGLAAARQIRESDWGRKIKIVALTGWGQDSDKARSRDVGCDGHLVKPVSLSELEKVLATFEL